MILHTPLRESSWKITIENDYLSLLEFMRVGSNHSFQQQSPFKCRLRIYYVFVLFSENIHIKYMESIIAPSNLRPAWSSTSLVKVSDQHEKQITVRKESWKAN